MIGSDDAGLQVAAAGCLLNMRQLAMAKSKRDKKNGTATISKILIRRILSTDNALSLVYKKRVCCDVMQHFTLL